MTRGNVMGVRLLWVILLGFCLQAGAAASAGAGPVVPSQSTYLINFEEDTVRLTFGNSMALRDEYKEQGVRVTGPAVADGGGIVSGASLGVTGYSEPGTLAFDPARTFRDGGIARGPGAVHFAFPVDTVQFLVGDSSSMAAGLAAGDVTFEAFDRDGASITSLMKNDVTSTMQSVTIDWPGIRSLEIGFTGGRLILDDFAYTRKVTVSPREGTFTTAQNFDLSLLVYPGGRTITGTLITANGSDITAAVEICTVAGTHPDGTTFRCPDINSLLPAGVVEIEVTVNFDDGSSGYDRVVWEILGGVER